MEEKNKKKKPKVIKANTAEGKKKYEERAKRLVAEQKAGLKSEKQSATKMGYVMKMGSKQKNDPNNFSQKDQGIMKQLPPPPKTIGGLGLVEYFGPGIAAKLPKIFKYITGYKDYAKVTSKAIPRNKPYIVGGKKYGYITKDGKVTSSKYENMTQYSPKNRKPTFKSPKIIEKAKAFALSKKDKPAYGIDQYKYAKTKGKASINRIKKGLK
jgi:hypothetical protein